MWLGQSRFSACVIDNFHDPVLCDQTHLCPRIFSAHSINIDVQTLSIVTSVLSGYVTESHSTTDVIPLDVAQMFQIDRCKSSLLCARRHFTRQMTTRRNVTSQVPRIICFTQLLPLGQSGPAGAFYTSNIQNAFQTSKLPFRG